MSYTPTPTAACTRCGNPLMPGDAHCRNCGQPVAGATSPPPPGAAPGATPEGAGQPPAASYGPPPQGPAPYGPPPQGPPPQGPPPEEPPSPGLPPMGPPPRVAAGEEDDAGATRRFVPGEIPGVPTPQGTPPGPVPGPQEVAAPPPPAPGPPWASPGAPPPPGAVTYGPPPDQPPAPPSEAPPGAPTAPPPGGGYQEAPTQVVPGAQPPAGQPGAWPPSPPGAPQPAQPPPPQAWQGPTVYPGAPAPAPAVPFGGAPAQRGAVVAPKGPANIVARIAFVLALLGGAAMIAAAFLPIYSFPSGTPSEVTKLNSLLNQTDKGDAYALIACGAGAVVVGLLFNLRVVAGSFLRFILGVLVAGASGFALYIAIHDLSQARDAVDTAAGSGVSVSIGLYVAAAGAAVGIVGGLLEFFGRASPAA